MSKIRRICLYGGSGLGKSVVAAHLFAELKKLHINIELITEVVKPLAIQKRFPKSFDQFKILGKQIAKEDNILPYIDYIITDSPVLLNAAYSKYYNCSYWKQCEEVAILFEQQYPGLHILLTRDGLPYDTCGRFQNETQAKEMDENIKQLLDKYVSYITIPSVDFNQIYATVLKEIYVS